MKVWLLAVIAVSVLMSILVSLLPDGTLKKSATTGIGFVYLIALLSPLIGFAGTDFTPETLLDDVIRDYAWKNDTAMTEESDYMDKVISEYKKRIETECESLLQEIDGYVCDIGVTVEENTDAENFGSVTAVHCVLTEEGAAGEDIVKPVQGIDRIVIDFHGIRTESETDAEALDEKQRGASAAVREKLVSLLGIGEASVNVVFE